MAGDDLYVTETTELTPEQFLAMWRRGDPDDEHIEQAVACARQVLAAAGYDMTLPPNLLVRDTSEHQDHGLAARVIYHADAMARAMADGRIFDVRKHAMRFSSRLERAQHSEAWGEAVRQKQGRDERNRCNNAASHDAAARWWAPWQERYRELRAAGMSATAAQQEIGGQISEEGHETFSDKTLKKRLPE